MEERAGDAISSDDDEPLSVSLRRPTTFKETGLLQPQEQRSDAVTVSSSQPPRASLTLPAQNATRTTPNKVAKRAARTDVSSTKVVLFTVWHGFTID